MRMVCQQTILMKHHALFVIFEKAVKIWNCRLLQIVGGALRVNYLPASAKFSRLLITIANNLGPDQTRQIVGSDLDPTFFDALNVFPKEFYDTFNLKTNQQTTKNAKLLSLQRIKSQ